MPLRCLRFHSQRLIQIQGCGTSLLGTRVARQHHISGEGRCVVSVLTPMVGIVYCGDGEMKRGSSLSKLV